MRGAGEEVIITKYSNANAEGVSHKELLQACKNFNKNYCARFKELIIRELVKTDNAKSAIATNRSYLYFT